MANKKCDHGKEKTKCRDCGGGSYCEHERIRGTCSLCSPEKVFRQYEHKAKQRNLSFSLTLEEFEALVNAPCYYCGDLAMGIDRLDNRIGYVNAAVRNCVPACSECNFMKRVMPPHHFLYRALKIAKYQESLMKKAA